MLTVQVPLIFNTFALSVGLPTQSTLSQSLFFYDQLIA